MLLLMRRVGEVIRINKNVLIEIKQARDDEVTFVIHGADENHVQNLSSHDKNEVE